MVEPTHIRVTIKDNNGTIQIEDLELPVIEGIITVISIETIDKGVG